MDEIVTGQPADAPETPAPKDYRAFLTQVETREKLIQDKFSKPGDEIWEIYAGDQAEKTPFNILYSNTEILVPNVFSAMPRPIVSRRHKKKNEDLAARAAQEMASYCMDTNLSGYPSYLDAVETAVLDAALPGQGQIRGRVVNGIACIDYVPFKNFIWGYSMRWEEMPWVSFRHDKTKEDLVRELGLQPDVADKIVTASEEGDDAAKDKGPPTIAVYETWNKATKKVLWLTAAHPQCCVLEQDDPLQLEGFFPCPENPLRFIHTSCSTMPRSLYNLYKVQAEELNKVSDRIKRLINAIRVRGIYNGNLPELVQIFADGTLENALIPATQASVMTSDGGLDKQIWLVPVEKLAATLQQLFVARESIKATIYEILGIGDILRGVSKASETLGAQEIKDRWGSARVRKAQSRVALFVRDSVRLLVELAAKHTPPEIWQEATGIELPHGVQAMLLQQSGQQTMTWELVLGALKSDIRRSFVVDIETNSTVDAEATQDRQDVVEFMNALNQAMSGLAPLATQGPEGFQVAQDMLLAICKRFRLGNEIEGSIGAMKFSSPGGDEKAKEMEKQLADAKKKLEQQHQVIQKEKESLSQEHMSLEQLRSTIKADKIIANADYKAQKADLQIMMQNIQAIVKQQATLTKIPPGRK